MSGRVPPPYPPEIRTEAVRLVREGGVSIKDAAATAGCSEQTLRNWVLQADRDDGVRSDSLTTDEKAELNALRRRVRVLEQEKEILKKAAAWFAKETHSTPSGVRVHRSDPGRASCRHHVPAPRRLDEPYYGWRERPPSPRSLSHEVPTEKWPSPHARKRRTTRQDADQDKPQVSAPGANLILHPGGVAQLVERYVRNVEVGGSSPLTSTPGQAGFLFAF